MPLTRIQSAALEPNALTSVSIADGNVTTTKIADDAITTAKIAANAVITADIADGNVTLAKIANDAISTAKILNANVTSIKMSNTGVTASTYGGSSNIASITVDAAGRITNAANVNLDTINGDLNVTGNIKLNGTTVIDNSRRLVNYRANTIVITTSTTAVAGNFYVAAANDLTLTLPAAPTLGDTVGFSNPTSNVTHTIARNGTNIMSLAENLTFNYANASVVFVYTDATRGWVFI